jgi:ABC-type antimicrobial peptide transport system permease subunit
MPLRQVFHQQQFPFLAAGSVAGGLGALALGLACLGLYGLVSFAVVQRTREIGVRLALGATRAGVLASVLAQALRRVAWGVALGVPFCLALSALVASRVPGIQAFDVGAYLGAPLLLAAAALLAAYVPARRAASVDPLLALRHD